ncbi:MAG TPA: HD domain-containing phosphohydrolase [Candidatus Acidoferrales bacterium]|nr:HD domain-containing phosphohydrolase [Candidatus Acidoferrales bacterium]
MTLFLDTGGDPRAGAAQLADVLALYGALGDAAAGNPPGFAARKAAAAAALARTVALDGADVDAIYLAGLLHSVGAIGNGAYRRGERLSERQARMESWDVPAQGARVCAEMPWLPAATSDVVRWQSEWWDGTGFPDQLRWHGIPESAAMLLLADTFVRSADPEEALATVSEQSGRAFGPTVARAFTMWYHSTGAELDPCEPPLHALDGAPAGTASEWLDRIADRVDAHVGEPGRWRRIARLTEPAAALRGFDAESRRALAIAVRTYGAGELGESEAAESKYDPLARLGIDERAAHAVAAAALVEPVASFTIAAPVLRARSEWYDGTGKPDELFHGAIPAPALLLAAAIAYDSLAHKDRIDTAAGTQFDPHSVRAVLEAARALA